MLARAFSDGQFVDTLIAAPDASRRPIARRVLVVDDEKDVREALVAQLGRIGCEVDSTSNAAEAMRMLSEGGYDALLVDIRMPGTSGIDLHRIVAEQDPDQADRVVFMTGDYANEDVIASVKSTGNHLLEKPFTLDELTGVLAEHATSSGNGEGATAVRQPSSRLGPTRTTITRLN